MQITLYRRTFPAKDSPVGFSFAPFAGHHHTLTVGGVVCDAVFSELRVETPEGAKYNTYRQTLAWRSGGKLVRSRAREVYELAHADAAGFGVAK